MILVDTSVLINFFKGKSGPKVDLFQHVLARKIPFGISCYTYQEILQGARDEKEWQLLKDYLSTQVIYYLPETLETYEKAAFLFYTLRRNGVTPRSTIDMLIALNSIEHNLTLLHDDRDFDTMAIHLPALKIFNSL